MNALTLGELSSLRLPELQERFKAVVGEATRCPNRNYLVRRIQQAQADESVSSRPKRRSRKQAAKAAKKAALARRKQESMMVLPVRFEASLVRQLDAAWKRTGLKSRMDLFRRSLEAFMRTAGERALADRIAGAKVTPGAVVATVPSCRTMKV